MKLLDFARPGRSRRPAAKECDQPSSVRLEDSSQFQPGDIVENHRTGELIRIMEKVDDHELHIKKHLGTCANQGDQVMAWNRLWFTSGDKSIAVAKQSASTLEWELTNEDGRLEKFLNELEDKITFKVEDEQGFVLAE